MQGRVLLIQHIITYYYRLFTGRGGPDREILPRTQFLPIRSLFIFEGRSVWTLVSAKFHVNVFWGNKGIRISKIRGTSFGPH